MAAVQSEIGRDLAEGKTKVLGFAVGWTHRLGVRYTRSSAHAPRPTSAGLRNGGNTFFPTRCIMFFT